MLRIAIAVSALALMAGAAQAEPVKLTTAEMDGVTAGLTVNGNAVLFFKCDVACMDRGFTDPEMVVIAGNNDLETGPVLPAQVHDNGNGAGPWMGAISSTGTPADVANGGPIDHAPLILGD